MNVAELGLAAGGAAASGLRLYGTVAALGFLLAGSACGSTVGTCTSGGLACVGGVATCQGGITPVPETCDGKDNDCNGAVDEAKDACYTNGLQPPAGLCANVGVCAGANVAATCTGAGSYANTRCRPPSVCPPRSTRMSIWSLRTSSTSRSSERSIVRRHL